MNIEKAIDIMETWLERSRQDMTDAIRINDHAMYDAAAEKQAVLVCVLNELDERRKRNENNA